jgi:hypothetical protein
MNEDDNVEIYIAELAYGEQKFIITKSNNPNHIQVRTQTPLWHKENLINLAVKNYYLKIIKRLHG